MFKSKQLRYCDQFFSNSRKIISEWSDVAVHITWIRLHREKIGTIFFITDQFASKIN